MNPPTHDGFGDERAMLPMVAFESVSTSHARPLRNRDIQVQRAAITVGIKGMRNSHADDASFAIRRRAQ